MFVGTLRIELRLPGSHSLKEKRQIVKSAIQRTRARYNVSALEVDHQNLWQRGAIGIACVGLSESGLRDLLGRIENSVRQTQGAEVIETEINVYRGGDG